MWHFQTVKIWLKDYHFASVEEIQENTKTRLTATLKEAFQVFPSAD